MKRVWGGGGVGVGGYTSLSMCCVLQREYMEDGYIYGVVGELAVPGRVQAEHRGRMWILITNIFTFLKAWSAGELGVCQTLCVPNSVRALLQVWFAGSVM